MSIRHEKSSLTSKILAVFFGSTSTLSADEKVQVTAELTRAAAKPPAAPSGDDRLGAVLEEIAQLKAAEADRVKAGEATRLAREAELLSLTETGREFLRDRRPAPHTAREVELLSLTETGRQVLADRAAASR